MSEEYIEKVEKVFDEVCQLTDTDCKSHIDKFKKDGNLPVLVTSIFITLDKCTSEKCITNKPKILEKLDKFLKTQGG